ncbi:MAG TPA: T9SS type A sorting domain-containing protein, partial [Chitinophagaceae bacterium]|nr:T9SS type A sorting domain-containing protein [Chitinophagaceae bacterium]
LKTEGMAFIQVQAPAGLNNVTKNQAQLYPNPAENELFVKGNSTMVYQIEIFNVNGSKMLSTSSKGNQAINISELPSNLYMVKVSDSNGKSEFAKFMKK